MLDSVGRIRSQSEGAGAVRQAWARAGLVAIALVQQVMILAQWPDAVLGGDPVLVLLLQWQVILAAVYAIARMACSAASNRLAGSGIGTAGSR